MIFISKHFLARFGINNILKPRITNSRVVYNIKLNSNKNSKELIASKSVVVQNKNKMIKSN